MLEEKRLKLGRTIINQPYDTPTFYSRCWHTTSTPDIALCTEDLHSITVRKALVIWLLLVVPRVWGVSSCSLYYLWLLLLDDCVDMIWSSQTYFQWCCISLVLEVGHQSGRRRFRPRLGGAKGVWEWGFLVWVANRGVCREGLIDAAVQHSL